MENKIKDTGVSAGWYLLSGLIIGAAAGVLLAPKAGAETREDLGDWGRRSREKTRSMMSRISAALPSRVKAAAAVGAVKGGVDEAFDVTAEKAKEFVGS